MRSASEVEHWMGTGAYKLTNPSQTPNAGTPEHGSETMGDKLHGQKGNSPERQLRPPILR
jgi:hypothetical protein